MRTVLAALNIWLDDSHLGLKNAQQDLLSSEVPLCMICQHFDELGLVSHAIKVVCDILEGNKVCLICILVYESQASFLH